MLKSLLIVVGCFCATECVGQFATERSAFKAFQKGKWEKGKEKLDKVFQKDRYPVAAWYAMAFYYAGPAHEEFNLDSANAYLREAALQYRALPAEFRSPLSRFPVDSIILSDLQVWIDSAAFERAFREGTEESFNHFLDEFQGAIQEERALSLRDTLAFSNAKAQNTHEAMAAYLQRYPSSAFRDEAQAAYDRLLFRASTGDQRLTSFISFLSTHPDTPFKPQVEEQIFEIMTASGSIASFQEYLNEYPFSSCAGKAHDILYHLSRELDIPWPGRGAPMPDSLARITHLNSEYLVPFFSGDHFNLMNQRGEVIMETNADELSDEYVCGNILEDVLVIDEKVMARDGSEIFSGRISDVEDLGFGFLLIGMGECSRVVHKSGFQITEECVDDAFVVNPGFLALRREGEWFLYTLAGRPLFDSPWSDIRSCHQLVALRKNDVWSLATASELARVADQQPLNTPLAYDSIDTWPRDLVWVRGAGREGVIDDKMTVRIPFASHQLEYGAKAIKSVSSGGVRFYDRSFTQSELYHKVLTTNYWIAARGRDAGSWVLLDDATASSDGGTRYDTLLFEGIFAVGLRGDSVYVHCENGERLRLKNVKTSFIPGKDSTSFLLVTRGNRRSVFDHHGQKLFEGSYDDIQYTGAGHFVVSRGERKGLVDARGRVVLPVQYQAIGELNNGLVPLLKNMKFGVYDIAGDRQLMGYDKNLVRYNRELMIAFRNGKYGLVDMKNNPRGNFEYEEVEFWNDSVALVRQDLRWKLISLVRMNAVYDDIRSFRRVADLEDERVIIHRTGNGYGVLSSRRGIIIPDAFSDVLNLGSFAHPLYFTEKHVEEASIFVVVYYDQNGKMLRRQVVDSPTYDKLYCSDH